MLEMFWVPYRVEFRRSERANFSEGMPSFMSRKLALTNLMLTKELRCFGIAKSCVKTLVVIIGFFLLINHCVACLQL